MLVLLATPTQNERASCVLELACSWRHDLLTIRELKFRRTTSLRTQTSGVGVGRPCVQLGVPKKNEIPRCQHQRSCLL